MQHWSLANDLALCVFDERGLGNGWLLPAGPLRESWPLDLSGCITLSTSNFELQNPQRVNKQELVQEKQDINRREREAREDKLMQLAKRLDHIERALTLTLTP